MESDLFKIMGLLFVLFVGCLYLWLKIKGLFRGFRKLKTESDLRRLQKSSYLARGALYVYNWWQNLKLQRRNPENFLRACRSGDLERVKKFIHEGIDINLRRHKGGRTGLMMAAKKNRLEVLEALLASGADVNLVGGGSGKNALIRAAELGNIQITKMLVDHGSNLDARSGISGKTALMKAAESGFQEIVEYLVKKGADVHFIDREGRTALSMALNPVNKNVYAIAEMLIEAGANVNVVDNAGTSPLDRAREFGLRDCVELLMVHGAVSARQKMRTDNNALNEEDKKAYEILGCKANDSDEQVKKQFHEMVKKYHPDAISGKDLPEDFVKFANERFVELHEAFKLVMDSRKNTCTR